MTKFLIGSRYFFSCYSDFESKDTDELYIIETDEFPHLRQITGKDRCLFLLNNKLTKEEYIEWACRSKLGMVIGKFLVPEFCEEIGFTIEDLPKLRCLIDRLDEKHRYEEIIYNSYIANKSFTLTPQQREEAYRSYNETRRK